MKWHKIKNIFAPDNNFEWMVSHAANPFAEVLTDDIFRIYFTCRNNTNQSYIGFVDVDFSNDFKITGISESPVLEPGQLGLFDDSGVAMGYLINIHHKKYLYYLGWNLKVTVPWLNTIGLAIFNTKSKKFEKHSLAPLLDRSNEDPFSISYPSILFDNDIYKMWYGSNLSWGQDQSEMQHVFKYAESRDGINWQRTNKIAVNLIHENEYALSKPFVIRENGIYKMWYSFRANGIIKTYRIGYAESVNGIDWIRKDNETGIDISKDGWDNEMICYPFILNYKNKRYMLYNGNGYGKTGFGVAVLEN
ncbi:MAG: hypothetical protein V4608_16865 [Bacteroidota bacterium]